jgi:hypothetical protein
MKPLFALITILLFLGANGNLHAQTDSTQVFQQYDRHWEMRPGLYRVLKGGLTGVIKANGQVVVPCRFDQVWNPGNNNYIRVLLNTKTGLYHLAKGMILPAEYDQIWDFEEGLAKVMKNRRFGLVNNDGLMVVPCEYNHIWPRNKNQFKVLQDGLFGFLAPDGTTIVPVIYQQIWDYHNDRARVLREGKMGFIDKSGNEVIPAIYDQVWEFEDNQARVLLNGQQMVIDPNGRNLNVEVAGKISKATTSNPPNATGDTLLTGQEGKPRIRINRDYIEITHKETPSKNKNKAFRKQSFNTHLSGFGLASNGYLNSDGKEQLPVGYEFMDPIQGKSLEVSFYPVEESVALLGNWLGLAFGLGLQYNNYRFDLNNATDIQEGGQSWFPEISEDASLTKSKLTTLYLNAPILAELQIRNRYNRQPLFIAGGVVGGIKLQSHTKMVYLDDEGSHKRKLKDISGIPSLRYGFMAKAGYGSVSLYGTYYPVSLFDANKGPELYPYSVGLMINFD